MIIQELPQKKNMKNHLTKHYNDNRDHKLQYDDTRNEIESNIGVIFMKILIRFIESYLRTERLESFKGKNNNIFNLIKHKPVPKYPESKSTHYKFYNSSSDRYRISTIKTQFES